VIEELLRQDRELKRAKINSETAKIPWLELQRYFAAGKVMQVSAELDLVDVAYAIEQDEIEQVQEWTAANQLGPVSDGQARDWVSSKPSLWTVVIKPWVLVQEAS
jgi:hypothetical protein